MGLLVRVIARRAVPRKFSAGGFRFAGLRLKKRWELQPSPRGSTKEEFMPEEVSADKKALDLS
jgi:hypothetical protein